MGEDCAVFLNQKCNERQAGSYMTIDDVKEIFFMYDCSLFAIAREEGQSF